MENTNNTENAVKHQFLVEVNDKRVAFTDIQPIGRQILAAVGMEPVNDYVLMQIKSPGVMKEISPDESASLAKIDNNKFLAWHTDRLYFFTLNGYKYSWAEKITENELRDFAQISNEDDIWLEVEDGADKLIGLGKVINLKKTGIEHLYTKNKIWKLDVQGIKIESTSPTIVVQEALTRAGINPNQGWIIILKVAGMPKIQLELDSLIDLKTPGIERLRLTPKQINNGEADSQLRRDFNLLPKDEKFLTDSCLQWETFIDNRHWLIIKNYPVPDGYTNQFVELAIEIPSPYPAAELDMFYCNPHLALSNGRQIPQTQITESIKDQLYQRWSRHREPNTWSPQNDSIVTHLALVEESIAREINV